MRKYFILAIFLLLSVFIFVGCSQDAEFDVSGTWYLSALENYNTGMIYDFDEEVLDLRDDGTGIEIFRPGDYSEEYSYITWRRQKRENSIEIKRNKDYIYNLDIVEISNSELNVSFYYENDPDMYYLATYSKMSEDAFGFIGCWSLTEYYEGGEYYDSEESFLYLYPDGFMQSVFYEVEEQITQSGSWSIASNNLSLDFDGYENTKYDIDLNSNRLEIYDSTEEGDEIIYVYKRYFGIITNTPPPTYPKSFLGEINRFFSAVFGRIADNLS